MLQIGQYNTLKVVRAIEHGAVLTEVNPTEPIEEVLLPRKYVPAKTKAGDELTVFVYKDSDDRPVATTQKPYATINQPVYLTVKELTRIGAFLDWGLDKDLFLPFSEQSKKVEKDEFVLVYVFLDRATQRVVATNNINKFIKNREITVEEGQKVDLLVCYDNEIGVRVIINQKHWGILFKNEIFGTIAQGDTITGYVKKIREDGKIDVSLQPQGIAGARDAKSIVMSKLKENGGVINLSDNSAPELIYDTLGISKKNFKKAVGMLYKEGKIEMGDSSVKLRPSDE
jgi:predicted RNA-binding protein (virulence factor B family)